MLTVKAMKAEPRTLPGEACGVHRSDSVGVDALLKYQQL